MKSQLGSKVQQGVIWIVAAAAALLLLISCNGDPLNTGSIGSSTGAPVITSEPQNVTTSTGGSATFSVSATGTAPITYQWQRGGTDIAGATQSSYTLTGVTTADNGSVFDVTVSNTSGSVNSSQATLNVPQ